MTAAAPPQELVVHVRALDDDALNDLLVQLPTPRFAALADAALAHPVHPAGLVLCFRGAARQPGEVSRWTVHAGAAQGRRVLIGQVAQEPTQGTGEATAWRAYTRRGQLLGPTFGPGATGRGWWERRSDAATALAWASPASGARCMALAAHARTLGDPELAGLLADLPAERRGGEAA